MSSPTQLLSRYPNIIRNTHKVLTCFSLILSLNSTYQVCAMKKRTKKNEEEIGNMRSAINLMKACTCRAALGPGLFGGSDVRRDTCFVVIGDEREKDGESREKEELGNMGRREKEELGNMGRRETTWQERMGELSLGARVKKNRKEEGGKKSEQDPEDMKPIQIGDGPDPTTTRIAEESGKVSDGSEDVKPESGDQKNGEMRKEDRGNEASENVKSVD
ncbi:hypothetical protein BGAL_0574g00030 [Botrytis galanthina]|uniref:Uncharacterized protein n=1 Tax=Botrytis galanthina TaxID=278940 RepID=A0A4S8QNU0_9HELO|nr:hypothetical protein BGAL_0574g00030 [Botrytis galanthina]